MPQFVTHNWNSPEPDGSWTQFDVIEGPLSVGRSTPRCTEIAFRIPELTAAAGKYQPSDVLYQYCIVHQQAIMYLTQVGVHRVQKREVKTVKRAEKIKAMQQVTRAL